MQWHGKRVLVTGAGGFIGSHLCGELITAGAEVTALARYTSRADLGNLKYLEPQHRDALNVSFGDVEDASLVENLVAKQDVVFHLAALIGIPYSYAAPRSYMRTNVEGTLNVLESMRKNSNAVLVHTSTSEVYGTAQYTPIDEVHPLQAQSPYAASKMAADKFVDSYVKSFDVQAVTVRPFNTFGPRQTARAIIPTVISQALACPNIKIGSSSPIRDFVYVEDTVRAFMQAALTPEARGQTVHVGTGTGISVHELVETIFGLLGCKKQVIEEQARVRPESSEVFELVCNSKKAKSILNWTPNISLTEGLERTISFVRDHLDSFRPSTYST